jgi:hypothetical protein
MYYFTEFLIISSKEYEDFATTPIRGYSGSGVQHCIGTGAYQFVYADNVISNTQYSIKNENYWNKDALEAQDLFVVDDRYVRFYATAEARTTALLAGDVDRGDYSAGSRLTDMAALNASAYHTVYPIGYSPLYTTIQFSCRENNDAPIFLLGSSPPFGNMSLREFWPFYWPLIAKEPVPGPLAQGVNKSVRQAISYAFDYPNYMAVQYADIGAIRMDSPLGTECIWNDHSVPYYEYNITKAREVLLADPYYATQASARGLDINSADSAWTGVGVGLDPINTFTYLDAGLPHKVATIGKALNDLGFALNVTVTDPDVSSWMYSKHAMMFDMFDYSWPTSPVEPFGWGGAGMKLLYSLLAVAIPSPAFNFGMLQSYTVNGLMDNIIWAGTNATVAQPLYNTLSAMLLEEAGHLYIAHAGLGAVINSGWTVTDEALERGIPTEWLGGARKTATLPTAPELTPETIIIIVVASVSVVALVAVVYIYMKKRK